LSCPFEDAWAGGPEPSSEGDDEGAGGLSFSLEGGEDGGLSISDDDPLSLDAA
jgi:hypothetical protein